MPPPHILLFPFMSKGHTIPFLQLARLLLHRNAAVTLFTTRGNRPFIYSHLSNTTVTIIDLPFPQDAPGVPTGVESTDQLPEISQWVNLAVATKLMKPHFEEMLASLPRISFMITDSFLSWTLDSANKFNIPRLAFYSMSTFTMLLGSLVTQKRYTDEDEGVNIKMVDFPWLKLKKEEFYHVFMDPGGVESSAQYNFTMEAIEATLKSYGIVINTFYELESTFHDFWNSNIGPPMWCVGPLVIPESEKFEEAIYQTPWWVSWLDKMKEQGKSVLYVAFGTQVEISPEKFQEIQTGLEESGVNFLWVVRKGGSDLEEGFEERVRNRGIVVREWVNQREILEHESVKVFLSHCGWGSIMESICAKVAILAMPVMWDQPLNAWLVTEVAGMGMRVEGGDGLALAATELMEGKSGQEMKKKAAEVGSAAAGAVEEGGSSWKALDRLINELHT